MSRTFADRRAVPAGVVLLAAAICLGNPLAAAICLGSLLAGARPAVASAPDLGAVRLLNRTGRIAEAEKAARELLTETEQRSGLESMQTAEVLDELAVALRRGAKVGTPEARGVCERALRIKERIAGVRDARYATSLYNLGLLQVVRGDLDSAGTPLESALEIRMAALGPDHPDVAQSFFAVGALRVERGDYARAKEALERAVEIQRTSLEPGDTDRAYGLNALGGLQYETGSLSRAIPPLEEAIQLLERSTAPNRPLLGACYHNLGCVYSEMKDREKALRILRKALRLRESSLGRNHPILASTLSALGSEQASAADTAGARASYERALRILKHAHGPDHAMVGWVMMKLGWLRLGSGDLPEADALFRGALVIQERALGPNHPDLWLTLLGLAEMARTRGDLPAARAFYERTLRILEGAFGASNIDVGGTLHRYASFLLDARDSTAAMDASLRAARVYGEQLRLIAHGLSERQALAYAATLEPSLDAGLAVLAGLRYRDNPDTVRGVWDVLVRWRALVLDEVASRSRSVGAAEGLSEPAGRLEAARQQLANLFVRGPEGTTPERYRALIESTRDEVERAERDLGTLSASFRSQQALGKSGWQDVVSALPSDAALVAFVRHGTARHRSYLALVLPGDRRPVAIPLGPSKRMDALVSRWTVLAATDPRGPTAGARNAESACRAAGEKLRTALWDPLVPYLRNIRRVFVVPDGSLHLVNLVALPTGPSEYLVETGPLIHYLSAERDLIQAATGAGTGEGLLALGGASFDRQEARPGEGSDAGSREGTPAGSGPARPPHRSAPTGCDEFRSMRFEPLPESAKEVEEIASLWAGPGRATVLTGARATERAFKELAPGRRVVHVATHAFFLSGRCDSSPRRGSRPERGIGGISVSPPRVSAPAAVGENPLRLSGIVLAGANHRGSALPNEEDGILTAEEIASVDLSRVQWAVLSGCDTGLGEIQAGEGVLGLRRAFQSAGAATLILSLWGVEDLAARQWMKALYEAKFARNLETDEAVRDASLGVLRERRAHARGTHPFYWAGFVAAGDWR